MKNRYYFSLTSEFHIQGNLIYASCVYVTGLTHQVHENVFDSCFFLHFTQNNHWLNFLIVMFDHVFSVENIVEL